MRYIKPKTNKKKVTWSISQRTLDIVSAYAKYTQFSDDEIVDQFLENLIYDPQFKDWTKKQRFNKKLEMLVQDSNVRDDEIGGQDAEDIETDSVK